MLKELHLKHVGPADRFDVEFADRLNIFTGDNGLGKSFLLDVSWYALTGTWVNDPAFPQRVKGKIPEIAYQVGQADPVNSRFNFSQQKWQKKLSKPASKPQLKPSLAIYIRVDGGFSVWDNLRKRGLVTPGNYDFSVHTLWNGLKTSRGKVLCNGLIYDWVSWQKQSDKTLFHLLSRVIQQLSHPSEPISPGEPTRVLVDDVRDIPTINLPYGNVPAIYASAGMQRILGIAYILVWAWSEHIRAAELTNQSPSDQLLLLIDEVECHLHPKWQRSILPAVLEVVSELQKQIQVQAIATTHAPLVLASLEPWFDEIRDKLFLFELEGQNVHLEELGWVKQGEIDNWLTSPIFDLKRPRSREAEEAVEAGYALMRGETPQNSDLSNPETLDQQLHRLLPEHDQFLRIWNMKRQEVQR